MSIFGKEPDTLTLDGFDLILPDNSDSAEEGEVMQIKTKGNGIIELEWDVPKTTTKETIFERAQVKERLDMGGGSDHSNPIPSDNQAIINMLDSKEKALYIGVNDDEYITFNTTNTKIIFKKSLDATTVSASGAVTGGSLTDGTATLSSGALSGATTINASGLITGGSLTDGNATLNGGALTGVTDITTSTTSTTILRLNGLPTSDPHYANQLWNNDGILKISVG